MTKSRTVLSMVALLLTAISAEGQSSTVGLALSRSGTNAPVHAGDAIDVSVTSLFSVGTLTLVAMIGELPVANPEDAVLRSGPFNFHLQIPAAALPRRYSLVAVGLDAMGKRLFSRPIQVAVESSSAIGGELRIEERSVRLSYPGRSRALTAYVLDSDRVFGSADMPGIAYAVQDAGIAEVDAGIVRAIGPGDTTLVVTYGGQSSMVPIHVGGAVRGDFDDDGDVDGRDQEVLRRANGSAVLGPPSFHGKDVRDLNEDGSINVLDEQTLVTLCSRPQCAVQ